MIRKLILMVVLATMCFYTVASAQRGRKQSGWYFQEPEHKLEITPFGGYVWTASKDARLTDGTIGKIDFKSSSMWGVAVDVNLVSGGQLQLLYNRQDTDIEVSGGFGPKEVVSGLGIEYWHIGGVGGVRNGNVMPFTSFSLGGTRYVFDGLGDEWKFSFILGLGAKVYVNERIGLKLQGRLPWTIFNGGAGIGCGTGGCYTSFGGSGVTQWDISAGLMILL